MDIQNMETTGVIGSLRRTESESWTGCRKDPSGVSAYDSEASISRISPS
jgi:hypothetical protein